MEALGDSRTEFLALETAEMQLECAIYSRGERAAIRK